MLKKEKIGNDVYTTSVFEMNYKAKTNFVINKGEILSSKTWSVLQLLIYRFLSSKNNRKILILKKCNMQIFKQTIFKTFIKVLNSFELEDKKIKIKAIEHQMKFEFNGNYIQLFCAEEEGIERKLIASEWNDIFIENPVQFSNYEISRISCRLTAKKENVEQPNQMFLEFSNEEFEHLKEEYSRYKDNATIITSFLKQNCFISEEYKKIKKEIENGINF